MAKKKEIVEQTTEETKVPHINDLEWSDHVLALLSDDEKIDGNPTVDGLRRIFEIALNCTVLESISNVVQVPEPANEKRATVTHTLRYVLNEDAGSPSAIHLKTKAVTGSADVYYGNCDKVYRNHPVAVAETRAEGRALRRALKLRKVVAAEELASTDEDTPDAFSVTKISGNQVSFIDQMAKRLNVNVVSLLASMNIVAHNISEVSHEDAVNVIRELSKLQQNLDNIQSNLVGYEASWRNHEIKVQS
jgi:hypothetical protein